MSPAVVKADSPGKPASLHGEYVHLEEPRVRLETDSEDSSDDEGSDTDGPPLDPSTDENAAAAAAPIPVDASIEGVEEIVQPEVAPHNTDADLPLDPVLAHAAPSGADVEHTKQLEAGGKDSKGESALAPDVAPLPMGTKGQLEPVKATAGQTPVVGVDIGAADGDRPTTKPTQQKTDPARETVSPLLDRRHSETEMAVPQGHNSGLAPSADSIVAPAPGLPALSGDKGGQSEADNAPSRTASPFIGTTPDLASAGPHDAAATESRPLSPAVLGYNTEQHGGLDVGVGIDSAGEDRPTAMPTQPSTGPANWAVSPSLDRQHPETESAVSQSQPAGPGPSADSTVVPAVGAPPLPGNKEVQGEILRAPSRNGSSPVGAARHSISAQFSDVAATASRAVSLVSSEHNIEHGNPEPEQLGGQAVVAHHEEEKKGIDNESTGRSLRNSGEVKLAGPDADILAPPEQSSEQHILDQPVASKTEDRLALEIQPIAIPTKSQRDSFHDSALGTGSPGSPEWSDVISPVQGPNPVDKDASQISTPPQNDSAAERQQPAVSTKATLRDSGDSGYGSDPTHIPGEGDAGTPDGAAVTDTSPGREQGNSVEGGSDELRPSVKKTTPDRSEDASQNSESKSNQSRAEVPTKRTEISAQPPRKEDSTKGASAKTKKRKLSSESLLQS